MPYCRNNGVDSDVYVVKLVDTSFECCGCSLSEGKWGTTVLTREGTIIHLTAHRRAGDKVPKHAMDRLKREIKEAQALWGRDGLSSKLSV
jgi:hypothetical protein